MKSYLRTAFALACLSFIAVAHSTTLTFDDVSSTHSHVAVPDGYGGLNWANVQVVYKGFSVPSGYYNGTVSGDYTIANGYGNDAFITSVSDTAFNLEGLALTAAWNEGLSVLFRGSRSGVPLYSATYIVDTASPTWIDIDFAGIDALRISTYGGINELQGIDPTGSTHFAIDNFEYSLANSIPVPSTLWLAVIGSMAMWIFVATRGAGRGT